MSEIQENLAALEWYIDVGVDEAIADAPVNRLKPPAKNMAEVMARIEQPQNEGGSAAGGAQMEERFQPPAPDSGEVPLGTAEACQDARRIAAGCKTVEELRAAIQDFEGCHLKRTAKNTVFCDGNPKARIMLIGEAPTSEEDVLGTPFAGDEGRLLDRMFDAIGLNRAAEAPEEALYLANILFWRPPGNRRPSESEIAVCLPFVRRHIELINPEFLVYLGGTSAKALLETGQGITKLRGKWRSFDSDNLERSIPVMPMYHPSFLLTSPLQKRHAWRDLLAIKSKL